MKKYILILILFKSCISFGQDSAHKYGEQDLIQLHTCDNNYSFPVRFTHIDFHFDSSGIPEQDTIPVIMLACDTTDYSYRMAGQVPFYHQDIFWFKGYEVFEETKSDDCTKCWNNIVHKEYLDSNKQPLNKSIIVWQSK